MPEQQVEELSLVGVTQAPGSGQQLAAVTVAVPAGVQGGDLLVVMGTANAETGLETVPAGWEQVWSEPGPMGTRVYAWQRIAAEVEPGEYTWVWEGTHWHFLAMSAWRGADPVTTWGINTATGTEVVLPVVEADADDVLVAVGFHWSDTPKQWHGDLSVLADFPRSMHIAYEHRPEDGPTPSYTLTGQTSGAMCAVAVLVSPSPPPPEGVDTRSRLAKYQILVDWDHDGGLTLGTFEGGVEDWAGFPLPPVPPETDRARLVSTSSGESTDTEFFVDTPEGVVEDHVLVAIQSTSGGNMGQISTPTGGGWELLGSQAGGAGELHTFVWWKPATGSEPGSYAFTAGPGTASSVAIAAMEYADPEIAPLIQTTTSGPAGSTPSLTPRRGDDFVLRWTAGQYTDPPPETLTRTYHSTWSASWYGYGKRSGARLYQGATGLGDGTGNQYGKIGFPSADIRSDLAGSTVDRVELRMTNEHSWNNSGLTARFGTHNNTTEPSGNSSTSGQFNRVSRSWGRGQTGWIDLPTAVGGELRDNQTQGITTGRPTAGSRNDYGYWRGHNAAGSQRPQLRITYTTQGQAQVTFAAPSQMTLRQSLFAGGTTAAALATRSAETGGPLGVRMFEVSHDPVRHAGVTICVPTHHPEPEPDLSPTVTTTDVRARMGERSLRVVWSDASEQYVSKHVTGLVVGRPYTLSGWVWVPHGNSPVTLGFEGQPGATSTAHGVWQHLEQDFTPTTTSHTLLLSPTDPDDGDVAHLDDVQLVGPEEDLTSRVLGLREPLGWRVGRDQARSLSAVAPADTSMEVDNRSRDYSPDNPDSPLFGWLGPGREVLIRADWDGRTYNLLRGHLDDYMLVPSPERRSVEFTALDMLAQLRETDLSTRLYPSLRTGEAMHIILDEIGWPQDRRDIDPGATTCRWWWAEGQDAFDAVMDLMRSEGPPALVSVSPTGDFVFRDRHHRLTRDASVNVQATFRDGGQEPRFEIPMSYDIGWRDVTNEVLVEVPVRVPAIRQTVWEDESVISLAAEEVRTIIVEASDPFVDAITPVAGIPVVRPDAEIITPRVYDYVLHTGQVRVSLSRKSGQSTQITLRAVGGSATLSGLRLRATPVPVQHTLQVHIRDEASIGLYGVRTYEEELPNAGVHDVLGIAETILGMRAERLPIVHITLTNANPVRMEQILGRDLSDRIRIVEDETFTDHDHYIESIQHHIGEVGYEHQVTFGCERESTQLENVFTFDHPDQGFDQGTFGVKGFIKPDQLFILDSSNLGEALLGY